MSTETERRDLYDRDPSWTRGPEAAELAGITYRQLDHWITRGYIHTEGGYGQGYPRHLHASEVEVLKYMALLVRHGLIPERAAETARQIHETGAARLGLFVITTATPTLEGATA